ncbi:serine/threonine-protein kinase [Streptomyces sp. NPDC001262]|uniref:serine/threonine-protein kinase n=1 Tax=unclassified Streptomyces TaxID=2593676 RepID=UPI0036C27AB4
MDTDGRAPLLAGRYRLVARLGSGGMGVVWRAFDEVLDREVAVKEVRAPDVLREEDVRILYARLKQEARAAARIAHPNVITVHDVVEQQGRPWIVMELVRGQSLADVLEHEGVLDPKEAARVGAAVLRALQAAHAAGVLHRDVKPANVLLEDTGRVVLTDFGIALVEGAGTLTRTGDLIGSPDYLSPERALGQRPGIPSDLWSLGTTLYAAVEGVSPFRRTSPLLTLHAVVQDELPPPRRAGALTPVLEGLLVKDPLARAGSAEVLRLLDAVAAGTVTRVPAAPSGYVPTVAAGTAPVLMAPPDSSAPSLPSVAMAPSAPPPAPPPTPVPSPEPERPRRTWLFAAVLALLLLGGGTAAAVIASNGSGGTPGGTGSTPSAPVTSPPDTGPASSSPSTVPAPPLGPGPSDHPTSYPTSTCGGGWVTNCG